MAPPNVGALQYFSALLVISCFRVGLPCNNGLPHPLLVVICCEYMARLHAMGLRREAVLQVCCLSLACSDYLL